MDPMFLPDVERNPQPGPYRALIDQMQAQGAEFIRRSGTCLPTFPAPPSTWPASPRRSCAGHRRSAPASAS